MFAYNYMVTTIRAITQELDSFSNEYATQLEHKYVDNRAIADEIRNALQAGLVRHAVSPPVEEQLSEPAFP
jgi:hypothetical protein